MKKNLSFIFLLFTIYLVPFTVVAQVRPVYDYGAIGLGQLLKKLQTTKSVMMIGAHPDDEDSSLLAYLARGENARTAYLSLTRGDGGQNLIGDELFEPLGVIRTEELLQARRLDGAEQFFTRAFDYGFSKTLAEAKSKWDTNIVLCDAVRAIRQFRPLVVISRFSGTPADGHGQHQFAGYITPLAVKAAADQTQCKDAGSAWNVKKFYVEQGFRSSEEPTLRINTGKYDLLIGRSYAEIAAEGRSQHKTQEQGGLESKGSRYSGLNLISDLDTRVQKESTIFEGIDVSIKGIYEITNNSEESVSQKLAQLQEITNRLKFEDFGRENLLTLLAQGWKAAQDTEMSTRQMQAKFFLQQKQKEFAEAIKLAAGLQIDALADKETVVAGENFLTTVKVFNPDSEFIKIKEIKLIENGWFISKAEAPKDENQNPFRREVANETAYFNVIVPAKAGFTQPYWLRKESNRILYTWDEQESQTLPFEKPLLSAHVKIEIAGSEILFRQPVEYRFADDIRGEIRRELNVVPEISINLDQNLIIAPQSEKPLTKRILMNITNTSGISVSGEANLNPFLGGDKSLIPPGKQFSLKNKGEKTVIPFEFTIPANLKTGIYKILPTITINDSVHSDEMHILTYPHIQTHRYYNQAVTDVVVMDLKIAPVNIGYIMGSGDKIPQAIKQMGLNITLLDENYLSTGDLSKFDTIVAGIRASQTRPDLAANNKRLIEFMNNGGTLIVQYQQNDYIRQNLPPFPAKMESNIRTVDENAPVKILAPDNPVFNFPNKITENDFDNWVQERNLYTFTSFDERYTPLLETHDAGEAESTGGMVYAEVGKGKYVYTAYSFFRQLPAGNPGAFRLFANMLSLPKSKK